MKYNREIGILCLEITDVYPGCDSDKKKKKKIVVYYFPQKNIYSWNYLFEKTHSPEENRKATDLTPEQFFIFWKRKEAFLKSARPQLNASLPELGYFNDLFKHCL